MNKQYRQVALIMLFYMGISKLAQTLLMTIVASIVLMTDTNGRQLPNTVNEIASQYYFLVYAVAALLVAVTLWLGDRALYRHNSFWNEEGKMSWQLSKDRKQELGRGAASAALLAILFVGLLWFSGQLNYLGLFLTSAIGTAAFPLFLLNFFSLLVLVVAEEYIFRHRILNVLLNNLAPSRAVLIGALLYLLVKILQFDLNSAEITNLILLNAILGVFFLRARRAHRGLAFLAMFFCLYHLCFGLPLWSQLGPSFFLFKHDTQSGIHWLTGADAGPLGSLSLTSLLLLVFLGALWSWRKDAV